MHSLGAALGCVEEFVHAPHSYAAVVAPFINCLGDNPRQPQSFPAQKTVAVVGHCQDLVGRLESFPNKPPRARWLMSHT